LGDDSVVIVEGFIYCNLDCEVVGGLVRVCVCVVGFSFVMACERVNMDCV